jgi:glutathione S-transferase
MEYVKPEEARKMSGVRVALTVGAFGPWGQAVKKMLEYKKIPYVPVAQHAGGENEELVKWTGTRNAPTIIHDDHPPLTRWLDQIAFVENIRPSPPLLPKDAASRIIAQGIIHELAGEWGFGWCRRLMLFDDMVQAQKKTGDKPGGGVQTMMNQYGFSDQTAANAPERIVDILNTLAQRLKDQRAKGSRFLVGNDLTAADIYWASFSSMLQPLENDMCPMSDEMRKSRTPTHPMIIAAKDPILLEHRNEIFAKYLGPVEF